MSDTHRPTDAPRSPGMLDPRHLTVGVAVAVTALGVAAVLGSRSLGYWTALGPGPGFFPTWLGVVLALGGAAWTLSAVRALRQAPAPVPEEEQAPEYSLPTAAAIVVSLCVLAAVLEPLGYQLSMFVFLMFHLLVLGRRRLLLSLVISLAGSIGVFWAFTALLGVALPYSSFSALNVVGL